jgi:acyl transferase domain-containing protein
MMAEVGELYQSLLSPHISSRRSTTEINKVIMYSSVGHSSEDLRLLDSSVKVDMAAYGRENLEQPVQFSAALTNLAASGKHHLLELGPHAALKGPIKQIRTAIKKDTHHLPYTPTLLRNQDADIAIKQVAGTLFAHGHVLDWGRVQQTDTIIPGALSRMLHDLPPYPWDYSATAGKLWFEPRQSVEIRTRKHVRHELLGTGSVAGDGIHWSWRNILHLNEAPWLRDHRLENQIVFPGTGYLALAIEAIAQMQGLTAKRPENVLFEFRQVYIHEALILPDSGDGTAILPDRELHTLLSPLALTALNSSVDWHEFSVSSWISGETTTHCTGRLRVVQQPDAWQTMGTITVKNRESYEVWGMAKWYKGLQEDGLVFGPQFQSLTSLQTDCNRVRTEVVSTTHLRPPVQRQGDTSYLVHPITIDACLQTALMGVTAGNLEQLRAHMPVSIGSCRSIIPPQKTVESTDEVEIHTLSIPTGLSTCRVDCTIRAGPEDRTVIDLQDVRLAQYNGKQVRPFQGRQTIFEKRYPCLEVQWKPDIQRLAVGAEDAVREYVADFVQKLPPDLVDSTGLPVIAALVDLAGHRLPRMRILELGSSECFCRTKHLLNLLDKETAFPRCRSWDKGAIEANGDVTVKDGTDEPYDLVLVAEVRSKSESPLCPS